MQIKLTIQITIKYLNLKLASNPQSHKVLIDPTAKVKSLILKTIKKYLKKICLVGNCKS